MLSMKLPNVPTKTCSGQAADVDVSAIASNYMEWIESQEMAIAGAKMLNHLEHWFFRIIIMPVLMGLIIAIVIPIGSFVQHGKVTKIMWEMTLTLPIFIIILLTFLQLLYLLYGWHRPIRRSISLGVQSFTIKYKRMLEYKYDDFVGFSIFDIPSGKLLVFGEREGRNVSIGISPEVPLENMRKFLSEKLNELSNEKMPEPRNPFKR
jgi:hypothetical protein